MPRFEQTVEAEHTTIPSKLVILDEYHSTELESILDELLEYFPEEKQEDMNIRLWRLGL